MGIRCRMDMPEGAPRRSIASYYYTNTKAEVEPTLKVGSVYMAHDTWDRAKDVARALVPPILWRVVKRVTDRF
jgi:hypothetical protein